MKKFIPDDKVPHECPKCGTELELDHNLDSRGGDLIKIICPECDYEIKWQHLTSSDMQKIHEEFIEEALENK